MKRIGEHQLIEPSVTRPAAAHLEPPNLRSRRAFTLLETLAVIGILGILILITLPAVLSVREWARRVQCQSNLRQLGIALNAYHTTHGRFPASIQYDRGDVPGQRHDWPEDPNKYRPNWVIKILPYIEQQTLYDRFDFKQPIQHPANESPRGVDIPLMLCSTDLGPEVKFSDVIRQGNWARGNYAANACLGRAYFFYPEDGELPPYTMPCGGPKMPLWENRLTRGVMGANTSLRSAQITDGMSKTVLLAEVRIGLAVMDRRGTWAMGVPGASSVWGMGVGAHPSPNYPDGDSIGGCELIVPAVGPLVLHREGMECGPIGDPSSNKATPRSRHVGGVYTCMCDGSVHWISDSIDSAAFTPPPAGNHTGTDMHIWQRLHAAADGVPVELTALEQ